MLHFIVQTPKSSSRTHESHKNGQDTTPLHPVIERRVCPFFLMVHFNHIIFCMKEESWLNQMALEDEILNVSHVLHVATTS